MSKFQEDVTRALEFAKIAHPRKMVSHHEAYGVIMEEVKEYEEQVFKNEGKRDLSNMYVELTHIAAMCQRAAEELL